MKVITVYNQERQEESFNDFVQKIAQRFKPLQIYLFSTSISRYYDFGCFNAFKNQEKFHYFILMIMESPTRNEYEAQDFCKSKFNSGHITILSHSLATLNESIRKNNRFFITVINMGELIYCQSEDSTKVQSTVLDPSQNFPKAQRHYLYRIKIAETFLNAASDSFQNGDYTLSTFFMHQVIEQCTIALIRVFIGYRSTTHNLDRQLNLCQCFSNQPSKIFRNSNQDRQLFESLIQSYSSARYKENFHMNDMDTKELLSKTLDFFELTQVLCNEKILEFLNESQLESLER